MADEFEYYDPVTGEWISLEEEISSAPTDVQEMTHAPRPQYNFWGELAGADYYSGVQDPAFRAGLSTRHGPAEQAAFLNAQVGPGNWQRDAAGNPLIHPIGLERLGIESGRMRAVDEGGIFPTLADVADLRGLAAPTAGGLVGGAAGSPFGPPGVLLGSALGAWLGGAGEEALERAQGRNLETIPEVINRLNLTAATSAGEGIAPYQALKGGPVEFLRRPYATKVNPQKLAQAKEVQEIGGVAPAHYTWDSGVSQTIGAISDRIRAERMMEGALGRTNMGALNRFVREAQLGISPRAPDFFRAGRGAAKSLGDSLTGFKKEARRLYGEVDDLLQGEAVVPSRPVRDVLQDIYVKAPKDPETGEILLKTQEGAKFIRQLSGLDDFTTLSEMQYIRQALRDAMKQNDLLPGMSQGDVRRLYRATNQAFKQIGDIAPTRRSEFIDPKTGENFVIREPIDRARMDAAKEKLIDANRFYAQGVRSYDDYVIRQILKDPGLAGGIDPELVVDRLFRPNSMSRFNRVSRHLTPEARQDMRLSAFTKIIQDAQEAGTTKKIIPTLNKYGEKNLQVLFGKETTDALYKIARVAEFIETPLGDKGGLVAAAIAASPMENLGKIAKFGLIGRLLHKPGAFKWLTEGLPAKGSPSVRATVEYINRAAFLLAGMDVETEATERALRAEAPPVQPAPVEELVPLGI